MAGRVSAGEKLDTEGHLLVWRDKFKSIQDSHYLHLTWNILLYIFLHDFVKYCNMLHEKYSMQYADCMLHVFPLSYLIYFHLVVTHTHSNPQIFSIDVNFTLARWGSPIPIFARLRVLFVLPSRWVKMLRPCVYKAAYRHFPPPLKSRSPDSGGNVKFTPNFPIAKPSKNF